MKRLIFAALGILAALSVAYAIQPGTTGTEKRFQDQGLRSAVLEQKNNTASATAGAATLNAAGSGIVTSESITTGAGSPYTLTLTNNMIAAADLVFATVQNGTNTTGSPMIERVTPAAGSVAIRVMNRDSGASFNGTLKIGFLVVKQSAKDSD